MRQSINSKRIAIVAVVIVLLFWLIGWYWSLSPDTFDVRQRLKQNSPVENPTNRSSVGVAVFVTNPLEIKSAEYKVIYHENEDL